MEYAIQIQNVSKFYGKQKVLDKISLQIQKGEIYGLLGHSGAGKSTLLRTLNALEDFSEGDILIFNQSIKNLKGLELRKLRKDMGMIFQGFSLLARKNVFENIALPLECWGHSKSEIQKRVYELLEIVGLRDKKQSYPSALSGGQKQRVAIARSLALNPKILLSDEATSALDPQTTISILDLLRKINRELGVSIVLVTHEMETLKRICHSAAFLEDGKLVESGDMDKLFLTPHTKIHHFLGETNDFAQKGVAIRIYFPKEIASEAIITQMARELGIDFAIIAGKLEYFGEQILGTLVIDVAKEDVEKVATYLQTRKTRLEILK